MIYQVFTYVYVLHNDIFVMGVLEKKNSTFIVEKHVNVYAKMRTYIFPCA